MRIRKVFHATAAAALALVIPGCGWTARDEFMQRRTVSIPSSAGDGSERIATGPRSSEPRTSSVNLARSQDR